MSGDDHIPNDPTHWMSPTPIQEEIRARQQWVWELVRSNPRLTEFAQAQPPWFPGVVAEGIADAILLGEY